MTKYWSDIDVTMLYDDVLMRSALFFRRSLRLLQQPIAAHAATQPYVSDMQEGLARMEAEIARRGLDEVVDVARQPAPTPQQSAPNVPRDLSCRPPQYTPRWPDSTARRHA